MALCELAVDAGEPSLATGLFNGLDPALAGDNTTDGGADSAGSAGTETV